MAKPTGVKTPAPLNYSKEERQARIALDAATAWATAPAGTKYSDVRKLAELEEEAS